MIELVQGNALEIPLADGSVQMVVTSPPYWGLRDYGTAKWDGGDPECDHVKGKKKKGLKSGLRNDGRKHKGLYEGEKTTKLTYQYKGSCGKCGAIRIDNQLGTEDTPEQYVENLVAVFREVRRVLHPKGTVWLNLGDSYATNRNDHVGGGFGDNTVNEHSTIAKRGKHCPPGLKMKDLCGIPWRVAFALQADGWWLRSEIIWHKPNPMPESATDRPTREHETVFLLTKSAQYYYDQEGVKEPVTGGAHSHGSKLDPPKGNEGRHKDWYKYAPELVTTRNMRTVWEIVTYSYKGAHFATYPPALAERCIRAGTSEHGCCPECGAAWVRIVEKHTKGKSWHDHANDLEAGMSQPLPNIGWRPACSHYHTPIPCVVFDPFVGSGTTLLAARGLGRSGVGMDLSGAYLREQARVRLSLTDLEEWASGDGKDGETSLEGLPLFGGGNHGA